MGLVVPLSRDFGMLLEYYHLEERKHTLKARVWCSTNTSCNVIAKLQFCNLCFYFCFLKVVIFFSVTNCFHWSCPFLYILRLKKKYLWCVRGCIIPNKTLPIHSSRNWKVLPNGPPNYCD
jgi:hypothetical protein